jgi:8-oxo-dGTP pyrophosphatase MutT (NUDIX family)
MPHIHTGPGEHDATASAFIVRFDTSQPQLLLHTHKKLHILMQPGGHIEVLENPWQAVLHEIVEETGYDLSQLQILQPSERPRALTGAILHPAAVCQSTHDFGADSNGHRHTDTAYAFAAQSAPSGKPDDGESTDLVWVTADELATLTSDQIIPNIREIGLYVLGTCTASWDRVSLSEFQA